LAGGVGLAMLANPVHIVTGIPVPAIIVAGGFLMIVTVFIGMKAMAMVGAVAVPAIALLGTTSLSIGLQDVGGISYLFTHTPEASATLTISAALTITIGSFISAGTLTPDFTRFAKSTKQAVGTTLVAFALGNTLMFLFGAIGVIATGINDISYVMLSQGLIIPAVIVLTLNIWTTNDNALYASGLGLATIFKTSKNKMVIINGMIGILFATVLYNHFVGWLTLLGSILPTIGAVIITDFYFVRKRQYEAFEKANIKTIHVPAIIAMGTGIAAGVLLPGVPPLNSLVATAAVYFTLVKFVELKVPANALKKA